MDKMVTISQYIKNVLDEVYNATKWDKKSKEGIDFELCSCDGVNVDFVEKGNKIKFKIIFKVVKNERQSKKEKVRQ